MRYASSIKAHTKIKNIKIRYIPNILKAYIYIITVVFFISSISVLANNGIDQSIQASWNEIESIINNPDFDPNRMDKIKYRIETESERLAQSKDLKLVEPIKEMAVEIDRHKRYFALSVLIKLGESEPVKQAFLEIIRNHNSFVGKDAIYEMAKMDKGFARDIAINALESTNNFMVQMNIISLFGVIGNSDTLGILKKTDGNIIKLEQIKEEVIFKQMRRIIKQTREYLEYQFNLPTEDARKSWAQQAYYYWLLPKEVEDMQYISPNIEYYEKADLLSKCGHVFSKDFLLYHLRQEDPLAAALIGHPQYKDLIDELKPYLNEENYPDSTFTQICRRVYKSNKSK